MADETKPEKSRARKSALTQERLKELLWYDPETGIFTRRIRAGRFAAGMVVGCLTSGGHGRRTYVKICVDYEGFYGHQLAFLYMTGAIPNGIDHAEGDGSDNSWLNIREANQIFNSANSRRRISNKSGVKGVYWHKKDRRWMARIQVSGHQMYLGNFEDIEDARAAYATAARKHFGEFARTE